MTRYYTGTNSADSHRATKSSRRWRPPFSYWESWQMEGLRGDDTLIGGEKNDSIYGGDDNDVLHGLGGNDFIDGGEDADTMHGGPGDDTYIVDYWRDEVIENAGEGYDTIRAFHSFTLPDNVESLRMDFGRALNGVGNNGNNQIIGNSQHNNLLGLGGDDAIFGGYGRDTLDGGQGKDVMYGGPHDDVYYVDNGCLTS